MGMIYSITEMQILNDGNSACTSLLKTREEAEKVVRDTADSYKRDYDYWDVLEEEGEPLSKLVVGDPDGEYVEFTIRQHEV